MTERLETPSESASSAITETVIGSSNLSTMLKKEIARSDRSGGAFCLLLIRSESVIPWQPLVTQYLGSRLRLIDEFGQFNRETIGVILPLTEELGATVVASEISDYFERRALNLQIQVFEYPHLWMLSDDDWKDGDAFQQTMTQLQVDKTPLWKRTMDILGSLLGIVAFSPVFVLAALLIRLTSDGPVFFKQLRTGQGGKPFLIYKFRTMVTNAEEMQTELRNDSDQDGPAFKIRNDPRITRIGWLLRKTSLDELPQLWNVLKGEMSLVGPRPLPWYEAQECEPWQQHRLQVKPGLTCIWQVEGRSTVSFVEWMRMDRDYLENRSFWLDVKLILKTFTAVIFKRNGC